MLSADLDRDELSWLDRTHDDMGRALERLAEAQPGAPAMHAPGRTILRYADLSAQIRYVRERLGSWRIGRGDIVVGAIASRPEMAVACATVLGAAIFAPLSSSLTTDAYCELLRRLRPKAIIVPKDLDHPARFAAQRCGVAEIDLVPDPAAAAGMFTLELARRQDSLAGAGTARPDWAYLLTTSGTTGQPKLVPVLHRRIALIVRHQGDWLRFTTNDVSGHLVPLHSSLGLCSALMIPLLRGASVVCLPESAIDGFFAALGEYRITYFPATFTHHRAILRRASAFPAAVAKNRLRVLRAAAGPIEPDEIDRIEETFGAPLLRGYSMTEAYSITHDPLPPRIRKRGSVGLPLCNEVAVMNEAGAIRTTGGMGEVVVRGPLVFDGYFDDPEATAAAFADGWLRTGDLGHFDDDGYLYLVGRIKDLINRGGEKISPARIDAAIEAIPGVRAAATFAIPHVTLGEDIAAAVVRDSDAAIEAADIIDQVRRRVGPLEAPRRIHFVNELPRTETGKVRRSELSRLLSIDQPDATALSESGQAPAQLSPLETRLVDLWSRVLQIGSVGVDEDFFLLGGDSLRGVELRAGVHAELGVDLPIELLFNDAATVAGMAREIARAHRGESNPTINSTLVAITPRGSLPAVFAVPGHSGNVLGFARLARELGPEQPFYGLRSVGLDGVREPLETIEQIAAHWLAEIRHVQPFGPYRLLGVCFGATVAFEMCRQLTDAGESVAFLALLDPSLTPGDVADRTVLRLPGELKRAFALGRFVADRLALYRKEMRSLRLREKVAFVGGKLKLVREAAKQRDLFRGDPREFGLRRVEKANLAALRRYRRDPLRDLPAAFEIFGTKGLFETPSRNVRLSWDALAGGTAIYHAMPGKNSGNMIKGENAKALAKLLALRLHGAGRTVPTDKLTAAEQTL